MEISSPESSYIDQINEKIDYARTLVNKLERDFNKVDGAVKTKRNILKEIKFLEKLKQQASNDYEIPDVNRKLQCTNLNFFSHLVNSLYNYENITLISTTKKGEDKTVKIDILANGNSTWVKIIARNSESIKDGVLGRGEFGTKNILEIADEFIEVASSHHNFFKPPVVVFDFLNEIDAKLEIALEEKGIILGRKFQTFKELKKIEINNQSETRIINLDITTMLAYVSELSNGGCDCTFNERLLNEQVRAERMNPIKPFLDSVFNQKELICCETAIKSFDEIITLLAGPKERQRAEELKKRIKVYPDIESPENIINIDLSSQIKERSRKIFAFGIYHKAVTVTSNAGFGRSAKMKNFEIPMVTHSARALTEMKESTKN